MTRLARLGDVALALAMAALSVSLLAPLSGLPAAAYPLALAHTLPLAFRARAPLASVWVAIAAGFAYLALGVPMIGLGPAALVWTYHAGSLVPRPAAYGAHAGAQAAMTFAVIVRGQGDAATWAADAVALAVAFLLGDSARRRRDVLALHRDRADQLERNQAEVARRAVVEERLRIARELHDVVAHGMSVIAVQASIARLVVETHPNRAREALATIEEASREALAEMRRLLDVLRDDDTGRAPPPGLADLDALVARTVAAGVPVTVKVEGERRPLPAGLELAAYRILQEALTNVARHAPGAPATVVLRHGDGVAIEVTSGAGWPGLPRAPGGGAGHGLAGMRERAAVYGGTVVAEPTRDGGFRVATHLRTAS